MSSRAPGSESPQLTVVESVRCLECGAVYAKPRAGGTVQENPGCPECGYVGWVASSLAAVSEGPQLPRSVADRQPHRLD
ncbi:MAG TPA: hypothetical protein VLB89_07835 [Gaiellaceae bacterium]|nr:hypothetical protein [Gaiellaceae bacterium]